MFTIDHAGTFGRLRRLLVPGGVLAAAVWGPPDTHLMSKGPVALSERLDMPVPPSHVPTPFSMSDRHRLNADLTEAGFVEVSVIEQTVPFWFASLDDYVRFNRLALPPGADAGRPAAARARRHRQDHHRRGRAVHERRRHTLAPEHSSLTVRAVAPRWR
jgi:hypothetical protein